MAVATGYLIRFIERRPNGRTRAMVTQRVVGVSGPDAWRWAADMIKGSTPEALDRLVEVKVAAEPPEEAKP